MTANAVDYLVSVLHDIAENLVANPRLMQQISDKREARLRTVEVLPHDRRFHPCFLPFYGLNEQAADVRGAYFLGTEDRNTTYVPLSEETRQKIRSGHLFVAACFVTPYPPGFPVLMPGQIMTEDILSFFERLAIKEIHGFQAGLGFRVFKQSVLDDYVKEKTPAVN
jgi:arginine decarboxylase